MDTYASLQCAAFMISDYMEVRNVCKCERVLESAVQFIAIGGWIFGAYSMTFLTYFYDTSILEIVYNWIKTYYMTQLIALIRQTLQRKWKENGSRFSD